MDPAASAVMRAIAARELKVALAERREAQAAFRAAQASPPSTTGWSRKPESQKSGKPESQKSGRRKTGAEKELADRAAKIRAKNRADWARRHPAAAAAERTLRKERAQLLEGWKHKNAGTPETHEHASRCNQGALVRLYQTGAIDAEQLASAVDIAQVAERIGADVAVKTASLETRVDVTRLGDGTFHERLSQVRREVAYTRWRSQVNGPIGAILDMLVGEPVGFTIVAKRHRMGHRKAKRLLIEALDLWPRILGGACKEVDPATLDRFQARVLD